jgi:hypothetical protein
MKLSQKGYQRDDGDDFIIVVEGLHSHIRLAGFQPRFFLIKYLYLPQFEAILVEAQARPTAVDHIGL